MCASLKDNMGEIFFLCQQIPWKHQKQQCIGLIHISCSSEHFWQQDGEWRCADYVVCVSVCVCVYGNVGTCHPVQQCGSLMFLMVIGTRWSCMEQRSRMEEALDPYTVFISRIHPLLVFTITYCICFKTGLFLNQQIFFCPQILTWANNAGYMQK